MRHMKNPPNLKRPSRWHSEDKHPGITIDTRNPTALTTDGTRRFFNIREVGQTSKHGGLARADYPMLPLFNNKVYYFEVTINAAVSEGSMAVGFCEDRASLNQMLGSDREGWGFHSENGELRWNSMFAVYIYKSGTWPYHEPYGKAGVTIGCGVNFDKNIAFYTRNNVVLGQAFTDIRGKLYPAVSFNFRDKGWRVSAVFPGEDGTSDDFVFKGALDGETTLIPPIQKPVQVYREPREMKVP
ncbi:concanavalin A-like lectin/glucanase domain-containing protein [Xylariaceae sp. FL1019]|nr:concanavalin A-like lectin/glucanase domain-containing protein [Xylariaceae sp. FL1019]